MLDTIYVTNGANSTEYRGCNPTDDIPTLSWWWGLSAPETLRAISAVA
jgi:hypothetical protein